MRSPRQLTFLPPLSDRVPPISTASDLARPPELNQARVHKCFLALANRKIITKDASVCVDQDAVLFHQPVSDCLRRDCIVGRASDSSVPPTFPMIVVFHHPPPSGAVADLIQCKPISSVRPCRNNTANVHLLNTWTLTTANFRLTFPSFCPTLHFLFHMFPPH